MSVAWLVEYRFVLERKGPESMRPRPPDSQPWRFRQADSACSLGHRAAVRGRLYVLVEAEQVRRVVLVLQGDQSLVLLGPERSLDLVLGLIAGEVQRDTRNREGLHRLHELAGPSHVGLRLRRVLPHRDRVNATSCVPTADCGLVLPYVTYRASHRQYH